MIARTVYGRKGVEIILPAEEVMELWKNLLNYGVSPCGLGARDSLRLERGILCMVMILIQLLRR